MEESLKTTKKIISDLGNGRHLLLLSLLIIVCSCGNKTEGNKAIYSNKRLNDFFELKYEALLDRKQEIWLSQVASDIEYIKLETNPMCMIGREVKYYFADSLIFVSNKDHILKFSREGKFIKKIGNPGRGPGEIVGIKTMSLIPDKRTIVIQITNERKLFYFSFDGELLKTVSIPSIETVNVLGDGTYIFYDSGVQGKEKYSFRLTNESGDTISVINNSSTWERSANGVYFTIPFPSFEPFHFYRNTYFMKAMYNDTVYYVDSNKIRPGYYINLGKYKLPEELSKAAPMSGVEQISLFYEKSAKYYYCDILEAANKIYMITSNFGNGDTRYLLYDRISNTGSQLTSKSGASMRLINDWDGGMNFWPTGNINDNQVYMPISIANLKSALNYNTSNRTALKYPDEKIILESLVSVSDFTDNPLIMVVTLN
jgi:hypothetical protein